MNRAHLTKYHFGAVSVKTTEPVKDQKFSKNVSPIFFPAIIVAIKMKI